MRVLINPGHAPGGYPDPGAVNKRRGQAEAIIVAQVGALAAKYLRDAGIEADVLQHDDLRTICENANDGGYDAFISIHCNAHYDGGAHGTETWYWHSSGDGRKLAMTIQAQIVTALKTSDRGDRPTAGLYVLKNTNMPAALVELAFISNDGDCELLETRKDEFARAIARGVTDYQRIK